MSLSNDKCLCRPDTFNETIFGVTGTVPFEKIGFGKNRPRGGSQSQSKHSTVDPAVHAFLKQRKIERFSTCYLYRNLDMFALLEKTISVHTATKNMGCSVN